MQYEVGAGHSNVCFTACLDSKDESRCFLDATAKSFGHKCNAQEPRSVFLQESTQALTRYSQVGWKRDMSRAKMLTGRTCGQTFVFHELCCSSFYFDVFTWFYDIVKNNHNDDISQTEPSDWCVQCYTLPLLSHTQSYRLTFLLTSPWK